MYRSIIKFNNKKYTNKFYKFNNNYHNNSKCNNQYLIPKSCILFFSVLYYINYK